MPGMGSRPTMHAHERMYLESGAWDRALDEVPHLLASAGVSLMFGNPLAGLAFHSGMHNFGFDTSMYAASRGGDGPSALHQLPSTSPKIRRQAPATAVGGKTGAPARVSTQGSRHRRKSCPKGQYWSFKQKKCVKSKFR